MTTLRLEPSDDLMHEVEDAPNFNESMYFNAFDHVSGVGGFFRLGNRPNEGYAEMTACVYLPGGGVAFAFARPPIDGNERFDAGGMRFDVVEPMERQDVTFEGKLCILADPLQMNDPKAAFTSNPWVEASVRLGFRSIAAAHGGEPAEGEQTNEFARGHYVQHVAAAGSIRVGDDAWTLDGLGLRDHSWGRRYWQSVPWYRWLTGNLGPRDGFLVSLVASADGSLRTGGIVLRDGEAHPITDVKIETEWEGAGQHHGSLRAFVRTAGGEHEIEGKVLSLIPLRNRREGMVTRITEGYTRWHMDGLEGLGMSEYLDQIVDGRPVGA